WSLFPFLPGKPPSTKNPQLEQRARGRLLAEFHLGLAPLSNFGQRSGWRRCEAIIEDTDLDCVFAAYETRHLEEIRILRWHLDKARERIWSLNPVSWGGSIVHGDFTTWNLRFLDGRLSGILDFELARWDHRVADFTLSWRGKYDEVIHGYNEVSA